MAEAPVWHEYYCQCICWRASSIGVPFAQTVFHKLGHQAFGGSGRLLLVAGLLIRELLPSENFGWKIPTPDLKKNAKIERGCPDTGLHQNGAVGRKQILIPVTPSPPSRCSRPWFGALAMQKFEQGARPPLWQTEIKESFLHSSIQNLMCSTFCCKS